MLNLNPNPSAIYRLISGQTIPHWLYLRILHLLSVCPFPPGETTNAFVISGLRGDGVEVPEIETVVIILTNELMLMDMQEKALIKALDEDFMTPKDDKIVWTKLKHHMQIITPKYTVSLSDLTMDPKPVSFGIQLDPDKSRDDTYPTASQRAGLQLSSLMRDLPSATAPNSDAVMKDNLDLSATSVHVTEHNYKNFMHSPPSTPIKPLDLTRDSGIPNNVPNWMWSRAPPFGQPHIDAFTGLEMKTVHHPVEQFNGWAEDEEEMPLLGESTIDGEHDEQLSKSCSGATRLAVKAHSMVRAIHQTVNEDAERPLSRWSTERLSYVQLASSPEEASEGSSPEGSSLGLTASSRWETLSSGVRTVSKPEPPQTAAEDASITRLRNSKSNELLDRVRRFIPNKSSKVDSENKPLLPHDYATGDVVTREPNKPEAHHLKPTTENLLRLFKEGHGLPDIKRMCGFQESVDDLQVMWWRAVVNQ